MLANPETPLNNEIQLIPNLDTDILKFNDKM